MEVSVSNLESLLVSQGYELIPYPLQTARGELNILEIRSSMQGFSLHLRHDATTITESLFTVVSADTVITDFDDTLYGPEEQIGDYSLEQIKGDIAGTLSILGYDNIPEDIQPIVINKLADTNLLKDSSQEISTILADGGKRTQLIMNLLRLGLTERPFEQLYIERGKRWAIESHLKVSPPVNKLVSNLASSFQRLIVLSDSPQETVRRGLNKLSGGNCPTEIYGADSLGQRKKDPGSTSFTALQELTGFNPARSIAVGDNLKLDVQLAIEQRMVAGIHIDKKNPIEAYNNFLNLLSMLRSSMQNQAIVI